MQTVIIELKEKNSLHALQELEQKNLIRIIKNPNLNSISLQGDAISEKDFKNWIEFAENSPTVDLSEAKKRWATQKKKIQNLIR